MYKAFLCAAIFLVCLTSVHAQECAPLHEYDLDSDKVYSAGQQVKYDEPHGVYSGLLDIDTTYFLCPESTSIRESRKTVPYGSYERGSIAIFARQATANQWAIKNFNYECTNLSLKPGKMERGRPGFKEAELVVGDHNAICRLSSTASTAATSKTSSPEPADARLPTAASKGAIGMVGKADAQQAAFNRASQDSVARAGVNGIGRPECIDCPQPEYSNEARQAKVSGKVLLDVTVSTDGRITDPVVIEGPGLGLEKKAVEQVGTWKMRPALGPDGKAVDCRVKIEVSFKIYSNRPRKSATDAEDYQTRKEALEDQQERERVNRAQRQVDDKKIIDNIGIHEGQSQEHVKVLLTTAGFKMPWVCGGGFVGATWMAECRAVRDKESISALFSIYARVRYIDPDTQISTIVNEEIDRLVRINYRRDMAP